MTFVRATDHLGHLLPGHVVTDGKCNWIYIGTIKNKVGKEMVFVTEMKNQAYSSLYSYRCSGLETALRKFPGLHEHCRWKSLDIMQQMQAKWTTDLYVSQHIPEKWDE